MATHLQHHLPSLLLGIVVDQLTGVGLDDFHLREDLIGGSDPDEGLGIGLAAARAGFAAEGLASSLRPSRLGWPRLRPRITPAVTDRLHRIACPTSAAALLLPWPQTLAPAGSPTVSRGAHIGRGRFVFPVLALENWPRVCATTRLQRHTPSGPALMIDLPVWSTLTKENVSKLT
ncbi:hypothetical protein [Pseudonocardia charpentierae]|uniref:Uncharacterized protein n=1 Tax=Pseudonocardia charpentierae TaxID=3075545 RepID=A0ABU2NLD1_9PSEU|nr:hypothetical protein [Pseudonocardia sp. DSM 45834]MDT0354044.1 hypothetical protein [Pseudonocardia sp. DSM 45834]